MPACVDATRVALRGMTCRAQSIRLTVQTRCPCNDRCAHSKRALPCPFLSCCHARQTKPPAPAPCPSVASNPAKGAAPSKVPSLLQQHSGWPAAGVCPLTSRSSPISRSSICRRPAVSTITASNSSRFASSRPCLHSAWQQDKAETGRGHRCQGHTCGCKSLGVYMAFWWRADEWKQSVDVWKEECAVSVERQAAGLCVCTCSAEGGGTACTTAATAAAAAHRAISGGATCVPSSNTGTSILRPSVTSWSMAAAISRQTQRQALMDSRRSGCALQCVQQQVHSNHSSHAQLSSWTGAGTPRAV
jgi:hypothetical protein